MVGELDVAIADQKATVVFQNDQIVFCFSDFKTVRRFVNRPLPKLRPVGKLLAFTEIALKLQVENETRSIYFLAQIGLFGG